MKTTSPDMYEDEIDLLELAKKMFRYKFSIVICTLLFGVGALVIAVTSPNIYEADILVSSSQGKGTGGLSSLVNQYGSIASLAGIDLGSSDPDLSSALALLQSRKFLISLIHRWDLKPFLFPESWNKNAGTWIKPEPSLVSKIKALLSLEALPEALDHTPSDLESYNVLDGMITVSQDKESSMVTIKVQALDPDVAADFANNIVIEINDYLRNEAVSESDTNISYLQREIAETSFVEFRTILYQLIESETKNKMLASVQQEYAFKVIDPALSPQHPIKPKRSLILVLGLMLGMVFGFVQALLRSFIAR